MKNILRIFKYDLKKIHKNVIAMIVIMGITVIPTLYAWFNIAASWDPYGNTGNLKVAVASSDEGYSGELLSVNLNLGDQILTTLRGNSQLDWTFTSAKKAKEGVKEVLTTSLLLLFTQYLQSKMHSFVNRIFKSEIHLPSVEKLWQIPHCVQFPIPEPSPFLFVPLEVHATSYFAASDKIFNFS